MAFRWKNLLYGSLILGLIILLMFVLDIKTSIQHSSEKLPDFSTLTNVTDKKRQFFTYMRPIVEMENRKVAAQHDKLVQVYTQYQQEKSLTNKEKNWLIDLAKTYKVNFSNIEDTQVWEALLRRVDVVPVNLALAQAANESSWGTSRFARIGNNLFGQWCFIKGCGLVPKQRSKGATHEVATFASVNTSVAKYILNLNTVAAYQSFRLLRYDYRKQHKPFDAYHLATGLTKYSEGGLDYVKRIQSIMKQNKSLMQAVSS